LTILNSSNYKTQKGKNQSTIALVIILVIGAILGYNYTTNGFFDEHTVIDDVDGLVYAFSSLMYGDVEGFFDGLIDSMVVIGLFMVVFALVHFLIANILKDIFSTKALQTTISLVITIYAFIDHRIYNYLISLNAFVVAFLAFCAFMIMLWGFSKNSYGNLRESQHELNKVKMAARQQYESKGYVDGDITKHIRKLQDEIQEAQRKYDKDLRE